jgi:hypothetical protein
MIRNCGELGINLQKIVSKLLANQKLVKLLYNTNDDPLSIEVPADAQIFENLIKIVPRVEKNTAQSVVAIYIQQASRLNSNDEFRQVLITVNVFVPLTQWIIKDTNLRPFAILGEIQASLDGKTVNGLGKISGGDFELKYLTDDLACYQ